MMIEVLRGKALDLSTPNGTRGRPNLSRSNTSPVIKIPDELKSPKENKRPPMRKKSVGSRSVSYMVPINEEELQNGARYPVVSPNILKNQKYQENMNTAGYESEEGDSIKVYVRVRPPAKTLEQEVDHSLCLEATSSKSLVLFSKPEPKQFSYDHVADMNTTQEEVFSTVGKRIIEGCVYGYNGTIFAYGQTGSGKTFTMLGPPDESDSFSHELRGVIPRGFEYMFSLINREQEKHGDRKEFICKCSFLEIYNEQIFDLLDPASVGLHLREDIKKGVFVEGLQEKDISSAKDAYKVLNSGWMNRRVASTSMNRESSRSHAVFTVSIQSKEKKGGMANIKVSRLHLVDLAGSERQKDTRTEGVRLKEAGNINRSLSALGNVIMALVDIAHGKTRHVHYRDSKLTFILRDSLGGNAKTYIIANIHPSAKCFGETLSTLNFARRAKMIKNKAVINEDVTGNVTELQMEIKKLKDLVSQLRAGVVSPDQEAQDTESDEGTSTEASNNHVRRKAGHDGNAQQWKEMMLNAISEREKAETEKQSLKDKMQKLEELCSRKEKFLQSTKMIVKLRECHIAKLERLRKKENNAEDGEDTKDRELQLLRDEIKILQDKIEHHPEVTRFALENLELRGVIKKLRSTAADNALNDSNNNEMNKAHRYTMQLERQLRDLMAASQGNDSEKSLSSSLQSLEASNAEIERLKATCAQTQSKLETSQQDLAQSRQEMQQAREELIEQSEKARKKELELQSDLVAYKRSIAELERALESFQLKTAVERTTMNDIHMQTIKTLTSPQKFGTPSRFGSGFKSTPLRSKELKNASIHGTPKKTLFDNDETKENNDSNLIEKRTSDLKQNGSITRQDSLNDIDADDDDDDENPFFDFHTESKDAEELYTEAVLEELRQLQKVIDEQHENLKNEESKRIKVNQINTKLQHQVNELDELLTKERSSWNSKEFELKSQLTTVTVQCKEEQDEKQLLKSEVEDLRILIQSADRDVESLKRFRNNDAIEAGRRYASLESKLVKIDTNYYNLQNELDETAQLNQQIQSDLENCREELGFTSHKNSELEKIINLEREKVKDLDGKLKSTLEKLEIEIDTNMKLAQEDKQTEVVRALEETKELRDQLDNLHKKCGTQDSTITKLSQEVEDHNTEIARLNRVNEADKEAVSSLRQCVQDLRSCLTVKEGDLEQVNSQLEESKRMFNELTQAYEEKKKKITKLNDALKQETNMLEKEKTERETEIKLLREEVQIANDQYKELTIALEQQQNQFTSLQTELAEERHRAKTLMDEIEQTNAKHTASVCQYEARLVEIHDLVEVKDLSVVVDSQADEMERLKTQLTEFAKLSENWENDRLQKNETIEEMKEQMVGYEEWTNEKKIYEGKHKLLEDELEAERQSSNQREMSLASEMTELKKILDETRDHCKQTTEELDQLRNKKKSLGEELAKFQANLENAQEDNEYMQEELERTQKHEAKVFQEKEELKSQLSVLMEEKTKLAKSFEELKESTKNLENENAKLVSHTNLNQKIQHHLNLKKENNNLKEQISKLSLEIVHWKSKVPKT